MQVQACKLFHVRGEHADHTARLEDAVTFAQEAPGPFQVQLVG